MDGPEAPSSREKSRLRLHSATVTVFIKDVIVGFALSQTY